MTSVYVEVTAGAGEQKTSTEGHLALTMEFAIHFLLPTNSQHQDHDSFPNMISTSLLQRLFEPKP